MTDDFTADDIRQMRKDGDLRAFLRSQINHPKDTREFPEAAPPKSRPDGKPVGAWPAGTGRLGSPIPYRPDDSE